MGVSDEAKNVIALKFLRKIKNKMFSPLVNSIQGHTVYPKLRHRPLVLTKVIGRKLKYIYIYIYMYVERDFRGAFLFVVVRR
jgi:hypothetical protein